MNTITLEEPGRFSFGQTPEPLPPAEGEAQVRVHRVGICGTDIHAFRGTMPFFAYPVIPGHELGVEVRIDVFGYVLESSGGEGTK